MCHQPSSNWLKLCACKSASASFMQHIFHWLHAPLWKPYKQRFWTYLSSREIPWQLPCTWSRPGLQWARTKNGKSSKIMWFILAFHMQTTAHYRSWYQKFVQSVVPEHLSWFGTYSPCRHLSKLQLMLQPLVQFESHTAIVLPSASVNIAGDVEGKQNLDKEVS